MEGDCRSPFKRWAVSLLKPNPKSRSASMPSSQEEGTTPSAKPESRRAVTVSCRSKRKRATTTAFARSDLSTFFEAMEEAEGRKAERGTAVALLNPTRSAPEPSTKPAGRRPSIILMTSDQGLMAAAPQLGRRPSLMHSGKELQRSNSWESIKTLEPFTVSCPQLGGLPDVEDPSGSSQPDEGRPPASNDKERKRIQVINEIISTEKDYIGDLQLMVTLFKDPLQEVVSKEELKTLFSNINIVIEVNKMLLGDMIKRADQRIGDSFLLLGDSLKLYSTYCANHPSALAAISRCNATNTRFRSVLAKAALNPRARKLGLRDFLIKPIQRVCKYPLFLRELIKHTEDDHPDMAKLTRALEKIMKVVEGIDEKKLLEEELEVVAEIISQLQGVERFGIKLMVPGRKYMNEGTLLEGAKKSDGHGGFVPRHYFLFSDLLVVAQNQKTQKGARGKRSDEKLAVVAVVSLLDPEVTVNVQSSRQLEDHNASSIQVDTTDATYVLPFNSALQKQKWMFSFDQAQAQCRPRSPHSM